MKRNSMEFQATHFESMTFIKSYKYYDLYGYYDGDKLLYRECFIRPPKVSIRVPRSGYKRKYV